MEDVERLYAYLTPDTEKMARNISTSLYKYDKMAQERLPTLESIQDEHLKAFWEQGYLIVEQAVSLTEVEHATEALMDIIFERVSGPRIQFVKSEELIKNNRDRESAVRKIEHYIDYEPRLRNIAYHPELLLLLERLYGEKPKLVADQAHLKPPAGGAEKPWHQDMAYGGLTFEKPVIGIWLALDPAELDNGCMHIIPRSHRDGPVPHYSVRDWQICDANVLVERDEAVPLQPGGALIFHGMLHHGTPPNFSPKRRRALQMHYAPSSAEKMSPKEYKRWFTNEMTNAEC